MYQEFASKFQIRHRTDNDLPEINVILPDEDRGGASWVQFSSGKATTVDDLDAFIHYLSVIRDQFIHAEAIQKSQ